jgi:hypothetical protein
VCEINAVGQSRVRVKAGGIKLHGWRWDINFADKRGGAWVLDEKAAGESEFSSVVVTD